MKFIDDAVERWRFRPVSPDRVKRARARLKASIGEHRTVVCHRCGCSETDTLPVSMGWTGTYPADRRIPVHPSERACIEALKGRADHMETYIEALGGNLQILMLVKP